MAFEEQKILSFNVLRNPMLTQFLGILYNDNSTMNPINGSSLEREILIEILDFLETRYKRLAINNHFYIKDIRVFTWRNYRPIVRYSYVLDLSNIKKVFENFEPQKKTYIRKSEKENIKIVSNDNVRLFHELHELTYQRQGLKCPISYSQTEKLYTTLKALLKCKMYFARDLHGNVSSTIFIVWNNKSAYYVMGANHPKFRNYGSANLTLWTAMQDLAEMGIKSFDLYGANTPSIAMFKRGFGGELKTYYRVEKYNSRLLFLAVNGLQISKRNL